MSYTATVFNVVIASPDDVKDERLIARNVIHKWNDLHSEEKKVILLPIGWETHSHPEVGDRPQAILNKQILEKADLLIGIFWTKFGTPTGKADSGTVEEIEEHVKAGKPAMLYFSNKDINPQKIYAEQYEQVKAFKIKYRNQSIYNEFNTSEEFKSKLYDHLVLLVNSNEYFTTRNIDFDLKLTDLSSTEETDISLSEEAQQLLIEASNSPDGTIMKINTSQGLIIQTNGKGFVGKRDARLEAIWEDALTQLIENDFIKDRGYKGEVFVVTRKGYEYADILKGLHNE